MSCALYGLRRGGASRAMHRTMRKNQRHGDVCVGQRDTTARGNASNRDRYNRSAAGMLTIFLHLCVRCKVLTWVEASNKQEVNKSWRKLCHSPKKARSYHICSTALQQALSCSPSSQMRSYLSTETRTSASSDAGLNDLPNANSCTSGASQACVQRLGSRTRG